MMRVSWTIVIYQFVHLFQKSIENFPNFDFDPNCLLLIGITTNQKSSNETFLDTKVLYENTEIFANMGGIPVKPLLLNYSRHKDEFPSCRLTCFQLVVFSRTRTIVQFYDEVTNWGNRNNVVIYLTLTLTSWRTLLR